MDEKQLIEKVLKINVCKSGDKRSPHKPLLILLSLARFQQGKPRLVGYGDIEKQLVELLSNFGPVSAKNTPQLPFWHLTSDGFGQSLSDKEYSPLLVVSAKNSCAITMSRLDLPKKLLRC